MIAERMHSEISRSDKDISASAMYHSFFFVPTANKISDRSIPTKMKIRVIFHHRKFAKTCLPHNGKRTQAPQPA